MTDTDETSMEKGSEDSSISIAIDQLKTDYDTLPYYYQISHQSHPESLYTTAVLKGFPAVHPQKSRILELACGRGVNLVSIARSLPDSQCVGIDLSERHVQDADELARKMEVNNVQFMQKDLLDISSEFGKFDYIIVNGTYTWVPSLVQDQILEICRQNLSENGTAMVHYASHPGSFASSTMKEILHYHLQNFSDPEERLDQALSFAGFFADSALPGNPFAILMDQINKASKNEKMNFYHEMLGVENRPCYFYEFMEKANSHGLQFVSEVDIDAGISKLSETAKQNLQQIPDLIKREQYGDFLVNRGTRSTLLCHQHRERDPFLLSTAVEDFCVSGLIREAESKDDKDEENAMIKMFENPSGIRISVSSRLLMKALEILTNIWPKAIKISELKTRMMNEASEVEIGGLVRDLIHCCEIGLCEFRVMPVQCASKVTSKPIGYPLARIQAAFRDSTMNLANARHEAVGVDTLGQLLMEYLDGEHDQDDLVCELMKFVENGQIKLNKESEPVTDNREIRTHLEEHIKQSLEFLANHALLIG